MSQDNMLGQEIGGNNSEQNYIYATSGCPDVVYQTAELICMLFH